MAKDPSKVITSAPDKPPPLDGQTKPENKKIDKSKQSANNATASGGAALNTSLVVQNIAQVKMKKLPLKRCS